MEFSYSLECKPEEHESFAYWPFDHKKPFDHKRQFQRGIKSSGDSHNKVLKRASISGSKVKVK